METDVKILSSTAITKSLNSNSIMDQSFITDQTVRVLTRSSRTLLMQPLRQSDHQKALDLIHDAASRGDNMGIDEIPDQEVLDLILAFGSGWSFHSLSSPDTLEALVFICASKFSRSQHRTLCNIIIITSAGLATREIRADLVDVALQQARAMNRGYSACALEVFVTCLDHLLGYQQEGFIVTCVVPKAGKVPGHKSYVNSYILYKRFDYSEIPISLISPTTSPKIPDDFVPTMGQLPSFLPAEYKLSNGPVVVIRGMTLEEVPLFYQALVDGAKNGEGYGWDELVSYPYFLMWYIDEFYNVTIQERDGQQRIIGFLNFGPAVYSRCWTSSYLSDGNIVLLPEFRGNGFGAELMDVNGAVALECGFGSGFGDTCVSNLPILLGMTKVGVINTGVIPRTIFFENKGWIGSVTQYQPFGENEKRINEEFKKNSKKSKL